MSDRIAVLGLGYVGCVSAACLASLGHRVTGVDRDEYKVRTVGDGRAPFYEPGLDDVVQSAVSSGLLDTAASLDAVLDDIDVAMVCVGTPSEKSGNLGLEQIHRVVGEIARTLGRRKKPLIIAIRSTVLPGTCEQFVIAPLQGLGCVSVVSNPEFLREGAAVRDFMEPSLLVAGSDTREAAERVARLYAPLGVAPRIVSLRTAEMIKYACNAFHAVKIAFANEIGALSRRLDVDGDEVMTTLCDDRKLNISPAYLKPGFAFGGSCLPKDLRALTYRAGRLDMNLPLIESTLPSNQEHLRRAMEAALDVPGSRLGVVGLAFKENTDDLRESPVVALLEYLIGKGREVRVWDPHIQLDSIYGSNRNFVLRQIPHIGRLLDLSLEDTLGWADQVMVAQRPSAGAWDAIERSGKPVMNLIGRF